MSYERDVGDQYFPPPQWALRESYAAEVLRRGATKPDAASAVVGAAASAQAAQLLFCIPGNDPSTSFRDVSGNSATAVPDAGNSGPYATEGYMATVAATNGGITIANASLPINLTKQSLCLAFVMKKGIPAGSEPILALSGGVGASQTGFYISHRATTGALKIVRPWPV